MATTVPIGPKLSSKATRDLQRILAIPSRDLGLLERQISSRREPILKQKELVVLLSEHVAEDAARALADVLIYVGFIARRRGFTHSDAVTFLESGIQSIEPSEGNSAASKQVAAVLAQLAGHPSIVALIKALDLSTEYTNMLDNVRIITDIRPIFNDVDQQIVAAVLSHVLRLTYMHDGDSKTISMAMDDSDLEKMRLACKRAQKKAVAIAGEERDKLSKIPLVRTGEAFDVT